jgi:hypothetical protein
MKESLSQIIENKLFAEDAFSKLLKLIILEPAEEILKKDCSFILLSELGLEEESVVVL